MKIIKQTHILHGPPEEVYMALTNPFTIELWTGYPAEMSTEPGFEFSMWEGDIVGKVLKCEQDKLVEQEWYFGEQEEQSVVTFNLSAKGEHTEVQLTHINIPEDAYDEMKDGWKNMFFAQLKKYYK